MIESAAALIAASAIAVASLLRARAAEKALEAARRRERALEERNRELDAFAGRVAHDLHNLLAPIRFHARMLEMDGGHDDAPDVARLTDRAVRTLAALLLFARAGRGDPEAHASVRAIVDEVTEDLAPIARNIGAHVDVAVDDIAVACPPDLLRVVVENLVSNALKFLADRPRREVTIAAVDLGDACELRVTDSGPGIPAEQRERIFEPLWRGPGVRVPGTGLGLATVLRIVRAHGGAVTVESEPEHGTTFRVELPLAKDERDHARPVSGTHEIPRATAPPRVPLARKSGGSDR